MAPHQYLQQVHGARQVGIVGWGVGGRAALAAAIAMPAQLGAAVVYDTPPTTDPDVVGTLDVPLLALYGGQDPVASLDDIRRTFKRDFGLEVAISGVPEGLLDNDGFLGAQMARFDVVGARYFYFDHATDADRPSRQGPEGGRPG